MSTPLAYEVSTGHGHVVVRVHASIFTDNRGPLLNTLLQLAGTAPARIILDLSEVPVCDAAALNMLVQTHHRATAAGGWLRLAGPRPLVCRVLQITDLDRLIPSYADVTAAAHAA